MLDPDVLRVSATPLYRQTGREAQARADGSNGPGGTCRQASLVPVARRGRLVGTGCGLRLAGPR